MLAVEQDEVDSGVGERLGGERRAEAERVAEGWLALEHLLLGGVGPHAAVLLWIPRARRRAIARSSWRRARPAALAGVGGIVACRPPTVQADRAGNGDTALHRSPRPPLCWERSAPCAPRGGQALSNEHAPVPRAIFGLGCP